MVSKDFNKITLVCITMRFKCSSVAMRRKRCMSSATQILQVRALVYSLYKVTSESTFENVCAVVVRDEGPRIRAPDVGTHHWRLDLDVPTLKVGADQGNKFSNKYPGMFTI